MFLQTGGGGKGIRPNQQHQQQHHHQTHHQSHHQTHHPHAPQQQQQQPQTQTVHHVHPASQQTHSHHPHQQHQHQHPHQQHQQPQSQQQQQQQQQQQSQQHHHPPIAYYSYQLSQAQPQPPAQHPQAPNNAAVTASQMAPSPPTQINTVGTSSAVSATQSHSLVGGVSGGMSGSGANNTNAATNIARQHAAAVAAAASVNGGANMQHYTTGTALMQTPATSTAFMTTTYLQQYQSAAVMAAAAAAAQYNNNAVAAAAAAANNHNGPGNTQTATSMYQQQQQQHHQAALHHTQTQLHAHYYSGAGATPTPPPHLHAAHHHPQQHQLRGVLTAAPHQRQPQTTYLLPASTIFALPPGPLAAAPRTSLLAASTHQQQANTGGGMSVSPLLQSGARAAAGGPTAYITAPFCQPPLPMGAAGLTPPQPLLATPTAMAQQTLQTYGHLTGAATSNSSSTTSLSIGGGGGGASGGASGVGVTNTVGTETVKPRRHAIPIIHPITHENILDPKPQKKSTAVEVKPSPTEIVSGTQDSSITCVIDPTDKSITVSISKTHSFTSNAALTETMAPELGTENITNTDGVCNTPVILGKEKIDQQMQTDAVRDSSTCRPVSTYDIHATDCSPPNSAISADEEDCENFAYADLKAGQCSDSQLDCNEALMTATYMNEEDQQVSLCDEQSGLHATASLHSATGDDGEDSIYDEESTSLMDMVENEPENSIPLDGYGEEQHIIQQQQHFHFHGSDADELVMQYQYEESDISVVPSAATLSGCEEGLIEASSSAYQPEESSAASVTVFPVQSGESTNFDQIEDIVTTTTIACNDNLRASAGADSVTQISSSGLTTATTVTQGATDVTKGQLKSTKSVTSASSETGATSISSVSAPITITAPTVKSTTQKHSPNTSGASSSATSTPTHHSYTQSQQQQTQRQQYQNQQEQPSLQQPQPQQKKGAATTLSNAHNTMASTSGGASGTSSGSLISQTSNSTANTKKNRKASKRAKESQKKLNKQSEANSQRSNSATLSSNNSNNNNNNSCSGNNNNNNNNKNTLNNTNNINNNLATKSMTTTTTATTTNILTDKNNANSFSDSSILRETTTTANLGQQQQQQRSGSVTKSGSSTHSMTAKTNTKSDSLTDVDEASSQPQKPTKHLKSQEIEAQFMKQLQPPPQLQFLNSSSSACEDEEEFTARMQMQLQQDAEDAAKGFSDLKFGEFEEDKDCEAAISPPIEMKQQKSKQSTKSHATQEHAHTKNKADTTKDTVDSTAHVSKTPLARSSSTVDPRTSSQKSTNASKTATNIIDVAAEPLKARKYSLDELRALSKSSEARKPPMVSCQRGDCISQLFVSRQQHHHLTHHAHNMSAMHQHLQQQQYQHMNFNESMELVSGKRGRSGQAKKHHEHQAGGGAMSGVLSVAAASGSGGSGVGAGGIGNVGGLTAQQQRRVDFIRVQLSLKEEIKLSECENAWQPETLRSKSSNVSPSDANDDIDVVLKKVRGVLNKLTPDNFDVLLKSMTSISMNTAEKMQQVMLLIFEKTVSEPNFAPTYAKFCKVLFQEIKAESKTLFTTSLINRIQHEFETNVNDANAKKMKLQPLVDKIDGCADNKERLELQSELEDQEYQFRRRAWGTVRFIGEMFKLQSLTNDRVFICIESLLEHGSEEKLEYMCKLLTTVGHLLESPEHTGNARMDNIFRKIQDIIHKSRSNKASAASRYKISSRVRFMMQDVMDLRARTWDHPQAHGQSHQQQQQQQMMSQQQQQQQQSNQRRSALGGGKQDDKMQGGASGGGGSIYEKNNRLGNYGGGGGGNAGGGGGNQRHYFQKSQKSQQYMQQHEQKLNIDLNKLKFTSDEVTQSTTKLGSSHQYLWRTFGRQGASTNLNSNTNAPATLLSINTANMNANNSSSGFKRQSSMLGTTTTTTMPSLANNPFQVLDRQDTYTRATSPPEQKSKQFEDNADLPDFKKMLNLLIEEVLDAGSSRNNSWQQQTVNEWSSITARQQKSLLNFLLTDYLHLSNVKSAQRKACAAIFEHLMRTKACAPQTFTQVYTELADELPDLLVDVPNLWTYVFEFIGPLLHEQLLHFNDVWLTQWASDIHFTKRFLQALIHYFTSEFGATYTRELWNKEFKLEQGQQFMSDATQWRDFINSNGFQYIHDRNCKPPTHTKSAHPAAIAEQVTRIEYLLNTANGCDLAIDYINTNVNINTHFIRSLTKLLCCDYATVLPNNSNTAAAATNDTRYTSSSRLRQLDTELFRHKCIPLLRRCLDGLETHELACLDAIVDAMQQLYDTATANQLICSVFDLIYDSEVIPKESFDKWYRAEQQATTSSSNDSGGGAAGGTHLDGITEGGASGVTKKKSSAGVASTSKASVGAAETGVSSGGGGGGARLNEELHAYMEKLL